MNLQRLKSPLTAAGIVLSGALLVATMSFAKGQSVQQRLRGVWVRADRAAASVTFVPTGANVGQIGIDDGSGVDYHFYALRGDGRIKINDIKVIATYRFQGQNLLLKLPGNPQRIYVRR